MKTREIACIHYICENKCDLGKEAKFYGHCQICPVYKAKPGSKPARTDTRQQRFERGQRREIIKEEW